VNILRKTIRPIRINPVLTIGRLNRGKREVRNVSSPYSPYGQSGGGQYPPNGGQYGAPSGGQYGAPSDSGYGQPAGGQYGQPAGGQYGQSAGGYGQPGGQYGQQPGGQYAPYGQPAGGQYSAPGGYAQPGYGAQRGYLQGGPVDFQTAIRSQIDNVTNFEGRAGLSAYWWYALAIFAVNMVLEIFSIAIGSLPLTMLFLLVMIVVGLSGLSVAVRRLHDTDKSGLMLLLGFIPIVGLILLVFMLQPGTPGQNRFG
jgi:uncharacterized membrane protein YhaH (DUF805 family)